MKYTKTKYWFKCNKCNHNFLSRTLSNINKLKCRYCANQLLCDNDCSVCYNKSFASCIGAHYWDYDKNSTNPRNILKTKNKKYWFKCDKCSHSFLLAPTYAKTKINCPYCNIKIVCNDTNCIQCKNTSFESCKGSKYWDYDKYMLSPRNITTKTGIKY